MHLLLLGFASLTLWSYLFLSAVTDLQMCYHSYPYTIVLTHLAFSSFSMPRLLFPCSCVITYLSSSSALVSKKCSGTSAKPGLAFSSSSFCRSQSGTRKQERKRGTVSHEEESFYSVAKGVEGVGGISRRPAKARAV